MLSLSLNCPLVGLDLETTGTHPKVDRIVQIAIVKMYPEGRITEWQTLVNPGMSIPPETTAVHGITDEMILGQPTFEDLAPALASGLKGCDYAGYNVRFDLRFLTEEFRRVRARPEQFLNGRLLDGCVIFQREEQRSLSAAAQFYLGEEHVGAHDAMADVKMSLRVIAAQIERYKLPTSVEELYQHYFEAIEGNNVDPDGKLVRKHGEIVLNFSNRAGTPIAKLDMGFLSWIMKGDFTPSVKTVIREEIGRRHAR